MTTRRHNYDRHHHFTAQRPRSHRRQHQRRRADYEIWACRFSEACGGYFSTLDPDQRRAAIGIASDLGYRTPEEEPEYNPGVCWRSGINSAYCHCGHHE
ncbi:hypothetical protein [Novosphingobium sp. ST904]|uniref:hypothetical protein n=1 Tax=Novosphingobium sp. ST904 TaxID=1684385 RepID=UPI0006C8CD99|nr:hypothetical protein [Novosphingobium sp. ST904]